MTLAVEDVTQALSAMSFMPGLSSGSPESDFNASDFAAFCFVDFAAVAAGDFAAGVVAGASTAGVAAGASVAGATACGSTGASAAGGSAGVSAAGGSTAASGAGDAAGTSSARTGMAATAQKSAKAKIILIMSTLPERQPCILSYTVSAPRKRGKRPLAAGGILGQNI
jgi:hypothetical protein